jgi:ribose transport system substrate-binding protein
MKMFKGILVLVMILAMALGGCSRQGAKPATGGIKNSDIKIGFSISTLSNPIWVDMYNNMVEKAKELGAQLFLNDAYNISANQITGIENFLSMGCQVVIVHAFDYEAAIPIVEKAKEKGVKVIAYDVNLPGADAYAGINNTIIGEYMGEMAGNWINQNVGGKGVVGIMSVPRITSILERENGIKAGIMKTAPNSTVLPTIAPLDIAQAVSEAENLLHSHPDINCIVTIADAFSLGVFEAFIAAGKSKANIGIFGCDAVPDAVNAIALGDIYRGTVFLDAVSGGGRMVETAVKMVKGEPFDPYITMEPQPVTFENVQKFLKK